jgi:hypothetical protein
MVRVHRLTRATAPNDFRSQVVQESLKATAVKDQNRRTLAGFTNEFISAGKLGPEASTRTAGPDHGSV